MVRRIVYCLIEIAAVALSFWLCTNFLGGIVHGVASDDLKRVVIPVIAGFICTALLGGGFSCFFTSNSNCCTSCFTWCDTTSCTCS